MKQYNEDMRGHKAIIYTRVSSEKQVDGTSLDSQEKICKAYCERQGMEVVKVFVEEGESAKFIDRTQLKNAINFCSDKKNDVSFFVVYKFDRFSRNLSNHMAIKAKLAQVGVKPISATEVTDDSASGELMEHILAAFSQFDNQLRTERAVNGMKAKLKQGYWMWDPPIGYIREEGTKPRKIIIDPEKGEFVKKAWLMKATGSYSNVDIANFLQNNGVRTANDKEITHKRVWEMFKNKFYIGIVYSNSFDIEAEGVHEPLISKKVFNQVQRVNELDAKASTGVSDDNGFHLAKTLNCPTCGGLLSPARSKGKKKYYSYYQCGSTKCEKRVNIPKDTVEDKYFELLSNIILPDEDLDLLEKILLDVYSKKVDDYSTVHDKTLLKIKAVKEKLAKIKEFLESDVYTVEEYKKRKIELESELVVLEANLADTSIEISDMETCIHYITSNLKHLPNLWKSLGTNAKIKLNNLIFPEGLVFEDEAYQTPTLHEAVRVFSVYGDGENVKLPR